MFPIIFSLGLEKMPDRANEISGLLIMAVSGGAVIPLVMGFVSSAVSPLASISVIGACMLYILWVSLYVRKN
jgi:fucose permease